MKLVTIIMRKILIIFCLFGNNDLLANNTDFSNNKTLRVDTTVLQSILSINLSYYIGKPVDSLFGILPNTYTSRGLSQSYYSSEFNTCYEEIFIDTFQFMTFPNRTKTSTWNMSLAKQETIAFIKVWKNNQCVYGCNNPNYY